MSFRNRPVLDRKHRPRWQDELRTQQLVVTGFAVAISLALGIFGATVWNGYWDAHLRPVAVVGETTFTTANLAAREGVIEAEVTAEAVEIQSQMSGGPRDTLYDQQLQSLTQRLGGVSGEATSSLVDGAVLDRRAAEFGLTVTDEQIDAEIAERARLPERVSLQLIAFHALPDDAAADDEPTDEQREAARAEAEDALQRWEDGEGFGALATELSDDFTAQLDGQLGWVEDEDVSYDEYFEAAREIEDGEVAGPLETDDGWALVRVVDRRGAGRDEVLERLLSESGVGDEVYRAYIHDQLLVEAFRDHFAEVIVAAEQPQRRVAQIRIDPVETPTPQERARHVLVQPDPELAGDQASATEEQWAAALAEAEEVRDQLLEPDADWFAIAEEHSDDTGSGASGGDLGWYDPASSPFVAEFAEALEELDLLEVSEPVRTDFGYHVIQKTGERTSPQNLSVELVEELRDDPDAFADIARRLSDDRETAPDGGEVGWVARYQLDEEREEAVFALTEVDEISEPLDLGSDGILIFRLLELDESREVEEDRLAQIRDSGFDRWLEQEVRAPVAVWVDPQFAPAVTASQG